MNHYIFFCLNFKQTFSIFSLLIINSSFQQVIFILLEHNLFRYSTFIIILDSHLLSHLHKYSAFCLAAHFLELLQIRPSLKRKLLQTVVAVHITDFLSVSSSQQHLTTEGQYPFLSFLHYIHYFVYLWCFSMLDIFIYIYCNTSAIVTCFIKGNSTTRRGGRLGTGRFGIKSSVRQRSVRSSPPRRRRTRLDLK